MGSNASVVASSMLECMTLTRRDFEAVVKVRERKREEARERKSFTRENEREVDFFEAASLANQRRCALFV